MSEKLGPGNIAWFDLTVPDAEKVKDFYSAVVGWKTKPISMGEYDDYNMISPETNNPVTGVCHQRGTNAELPPYWLIYITVANIEESINKCKKLGGKIISGPKEMKGYGKYCIIQDPAGAYSALFETI